MSGFAFQYRLGGGDPTVTTFTLRDPVAVAVGDMLSFEDGRVALGVSGGAQLLGAVVAVRPNGPQGAHVDGVTDIDAVYAVADAFARVVGEALDLDGPTRRQGVAAGPNGDFEVVAESARDGETFVRIRSGRHARDALTGGQLNAALARAVVRIHRDYVGRGPTKAQAFFRGAVVVVVMEDVLTKAEQSLAASGEERVVLDTRRRFQSAMRDDLVATVEGLTGRKVVAFMSDNHVGPDMATEVFVLDEPVPGERAT